MKKTFFYSLIFVILSFGVLTGSFVLPVSSVCAQDDGGFDDADETEDAEDGFDFGSDEDDAEDEDDSEDGFNFGEEDGEGSEDLDASEDGIDDAGSGFEEEDGVDTDTADAPESSGSAAAFGSEEGLPGEKSAGASKSDEKEVSRPRENPVAFPSNGTQAGETAELTLHGVRYRFRWCPAGTFRMGSPLTEEGRSLDEKQMETVIPHGFWILETEVSLEMFASFVKASGYKTDAQRDGQGGYRVDLETGHIEGPDAGASWLSVGYRQDRKFPVVNVTWYDAQKFTEWLNAELSTHEEPEDSRRQVLLPTEAQWEYACRAGSAAPYASGKDLADLMRCANLREVEQNRTLMKSFDLHKQNPWSFPLSGPFKYAAFTGAFEPNAWGICDMHGNVWEWCADGYADYEEAVLPAENAGELQKFVGRTGSDSKNLKVMRGGGWNTSFLHARSAARSSYAPSRRFVDLGFRFIILPLDPEKSADAENEEEEDSEDVSMGSIFGGTSEEDTEEDGEDSEDGADGDEDEFSFDDEEFGDSENAEDTEDAEDSEDSADGDEEDFGFGDDEEKDVADDADDAESEDGGEEETEDEEDSLF
ncbi:MAG: SUMF1/EgtB/PvdO family nonheme iron enzyme [Thermoguttaceae bacterium]|nr:SUMF1/EgtB/PvdO family nonheme iron enzyme [Thermoguttaceae bacterium]